MSGIPFLVKNIGKEGSLIPCIIKKDPCIMGPKTFFRSLAAIFVYEWTLYCSGQSIGRVHGWARSVS